MEDDRSYYERVSDIVQQTRGEVEHRDSGPVRFGTPRGRRRLLKMLAWLCVISAIVYAGDYISLRFRIPGNREQYGVVDVQVLYAIQEKANRTEFTLGPVEKQRCVQSLFPHFGETPCWYLRRHRERWVEI